MPGGERPTILRQIQAQVPRKFLRDIWLSLRYGHATPLSDAPIFVPPRDVTHQLKTRPGSTWFRRQYSGYVRRGDWDLHRGQEVTDSPKFVSCRMRWIDGAAWSQTPIFKRLLAEIDSGQRPDGCANRADLERRYAALDRLFEATQAKGRLLLRSELPERFRREHGGILIHVTRDGSCLRSGGGAHRFALAKILDLPEMPAQIGVVHPDAISGGHLQRLMTSRFD
ncbi:MAG: hypothetical protein ACRBB0_11025 [Pelagimonas sp.]|uniref:hypothetical protein n=1 Tax=Pelagimonas sp. TaxID=2073170 RepID=UPI003D6BFB64